MTQNNGVSFTSSFMRNKELDELIQDTNNIDLQSFCDTLELLKEDGKNEMYFLKEGTYKVPGYACSIESRTEAPEMVLYKRNMETMETKKVDSIVIGGFLLGTYTKDVIAEVTRILRRNSDFIQSKAFRSNVLEKLNSIVE